MRRSVTTRQHYGLNQVTGRARDRKPDAQQQAVVFIHGILSDHRTFEPMINAFSVEPRVEEHALYWFDYNYHESLARSAQQLVAAIKPMFRDQDSVALVCHSMGGLVARLALLSEPLPFVTKVVMLGTPNFGAFRTARLGLLSQMVFSTTGSVWGLFTRKTGIRDLTRVAEIFEETLRSNPAAERNADAVDYVTVPGLFFHDDRRFWDTGSKERKGANRAFAVLDVISQLGDLGKPLFAVRLQKPHDGIVEESSNSFVPPAGRRSEKDGPINNPAAFQPPTYAHVVHTAACRDLNHVTLHRDPTVMGLVAEILAAEDLGTWMQSRSADREASRHVAVHM